MEVVKRIRTYILKVISKQGSCMQLPMTCCISSVVLCAESSVPNVPTVARNTKMARWSDDPQNVDVKKRCVSRLFCTSTMMQR